MIENKELRINNDDIGALYPQLIERRNNELRFRYNANEDPEIVKYMEIDPKVKSLKL